MAQGAFTEQMQQKVFGAQARSGSPGQGVPMMNFEEAKAHAQAKRQQDFEVNKARFFGQDIDQR